MKILTLVYLLPHLVTCFAPFTSSTTKPTTALFSTSNNALPLQPLSNLKVAVVGGGPSGLLLTHRLVQAGAKVKLYEGRPRPGGGDRILGKAYALGVGRRGRTAIQSAGWEVWKAVQTVGFASERFRFHAGPLALKLRDGDSSKSDTDQPQEPSLLLFQSDLCTALVDSLEENLVEKDQLQLRFDTNVTNIDLINKKIQTQDGQESFDLIVGCDGVNSVVREAIQDVWSDFQVVKKTLPGQFKAIQLKMPPKLDPTAVALVLPSSGSTTAFVEPTGSDGSCCLLFAGSNISDPLLASSNADEIQTVLEERYPLLQGADLALAAQQLADTPRPSQASSVKCSTYHCGHAAVLVGDAAHSSGGVSGQGVNSALVDSGVLADALCHTYQRNDLSSLQRALLEYSQCQVPEGHALYDLSFPPPPESAKAKMFQTLRTARDFLFHGRWGIGSPPVQTTLTTSLQSFCEIRRNRQSYYGKETFLSDAAWKAKLAELDDKSPKTLSCQTNKAV